VSGKVLFHGKALPGGVVTFRPARAGQNTVAALIDEQGNYRATLPAGDVQIAVDNRELQNHPGPADLAAKVELPPGVKAKLQAGDAKAAPATSSASSERMAGTYVSIPSRFYDVRTSGLSYSVRPGDQPFDIELK
jgi:hypothetical protein